MEFTPNVGFKKAGENDYYDVVDQVNFNADLADVKLGAQGQQISDLSEDVAAIPVHITAEMPHLLINNSTGKTYRYGIAISLEGKPQFVYEEVV